MSKHTNAATQVPPAALPDGGMVSPALKKGTVLHGEYKVLEVLGRGSFGITYLVEKSRVSEADRLLSRHNRFVIKENFYTQTSWRAPDGNYVICHQNPEGFQWALKTFIKEARTLAGLQHSGIVRVLDAFEENGTAYFAMPFVEGKSLQHYPQPQDKECAARLEALLPPLLRALEYLHKRDLIHRDIKPDNILLTGNGEPLLIDFGAARLASATSTQTSIGTPGYAAPEQLESGEKPHPSFDLYALGATFYHLITGQIPPEGKTRLQRVFNGENDPLPPLAEQSEYGKLYSRPFLTAIDRALSLRRNDRWTTATEWLTILASPTPPSPSPRPADEKTASPLSKKEARAQLAALGIMPAGYDFAVREAVAGNDWETLRLLVIAGAANNPCDKDGNTLLHQAAEEGHTELLRELLQAGADVNVTNAEGYTPLHLATAMGHAREIRNYYAEHEEEDDNLKSREALTQAGREACSSDLPWLDIIRRLLHAGAKVNTQNNTSHTPLHFATVLGHTEAVKALLQAGADVHIKDADDFTPLHDAAFMGYVEILRTLLRVGADVHARNNDGVTPLHMAANAACVQALLQAGADVNAEGNNGNTPLHIAALNGQAEAIPAMIQAGADIHAKSDEGDTPLHWAEDEDCVLALLRAGADVHAKNNNGNTPLHIAAWNGHAEAIPAMIQAGADVHAKNNNGNTPLHIAAWNGHAEAIPAMIQAGADVHAKNNNGNTPLHGAEDEDCVQALLQAGADVHAKDNDGDSPLHIAALNGRAEAIPAMIQAGADVHAKNNNGNTPLHLAKNEDCVKLLRQAGANVHAKKISGTPPAVHGFG